jgi:uncharacterized membrane protein (DUF2068 family)
VDHIADRQDTLTDSNTLMEAKKIIAKKIIEPTDYNPHYGLLYAIAVDKLFKAAMLLLISMGAFRLLHRDVAATLTGWFEDFRLDPHNRFIYHVLAKAVGLRPRTLAEMGVGTFIYASMYTVEGMGLLLRKRWAEYMTIITTGLLLPVEGYELFHRATVVKVVVLAINAAIVAYLIARPKHGPVAEYRLAALRYFNGIKFFRRTRL